MIIFDKVYKLLREGLPVGSEILDLQIALKLLGFMGNNYLKQCDGKWGASTDRAIQALNWAIFEYANESIVPYAKITELLLNTNVNWFKVPFVEDPEAENKAIVELLESKKDYIIDTYLVPFDFLRAILWQETNLMHYDPDGFVFVGCDYGTFDKYKYRSRGWGMGQYTIKNHPPNEEQQQNIVDPIKNLEFTIRHLQGKFKSYCAKFRICQYKEPDNKYLRNCKTCVEESQRCDIKLPEANYHTKAQITGYKNVPMLDVCGWGLATERYNGAGQNAQAYKYEVLCRILGKEIR